MPATSPVTIQQAFALAFQHHQAGRLAEAEALYRQVLAAAPNHAEAWHHLGIIAHQTGHDDLAVQWIRQALVLKPRHPAAYSNLGAALAAQHQHDEAIAAYREAVALKPDYAEAHYNLAESWRARGELEEAVAAFRRALEIKPLYPDAWNNLGIALDTQGLFPEAAAAYRRVIEIQPASAPAHYNLGNALHQQGQIEAAITAFRRALEIQPDYPEALNNLGNALKDRGEFDEAATAFRQAIAFRPGYVEALNNLGNVLKSLGRLAEAIATYHQAIRCKPDHADTYNNLGNALRAHHQPNEAAAAYRRALQLSPNYPEAHSNLGGVLMQLRQVDEAVAAYRRAIQCRADYPEAHLHLGNALRENNHLDEALACYRRAMQLRPNDPAAHSTLIYALQFDPSLERKSLVEEQRLWNQKFCEPLKRFIRPHDNDRSPERRLRIGYVSPDFRDHVVGKNLRPLFCHHNHAQFEILCYSEVATADKITAELRAHADHWRDTSSMKDEALADMIRQDGVDILVDLAQHMGGNRLLVFAREPAPVQASFAGYPAGTGLEAIRHRMSDRYLESETADGGWQIGAGLQSVEQLFLMDSFWCYDPDGIEVAVNDLPALKSGVVTFGSLNNFCKINERVLKLWARVAGAVENSRLVLLAQPGSHRDEALKTLEQQGLAAHRVEFVEPQPRQAYLESYHRLDIALDPFPYNGHTTSLDALWMGVPVISLVGESSVARAGLSQLSNLGLDGFAAFSEEDYVQVAAQLAHDLPRLAGLRAELRSRMEASVLMDARRFARRIEATYRTMWRHWCAEKIPATSIS